MCSQTGEQSNGLLSSPTRNPHRLPGTAVAHRIEDEFDPVGNPQLIENVEQVSFHGVLAKSKFTGYFAIAESIRNQGHDLLLARRE